MSFEYGQARPLTTIEQARTFASAMRRTARPIVLVPLKNGVHGGHVALIRAARSLPRAVVIVSWSGVGSEALSDTGTPPRLAMSESDRAALVEEKVDAIWQVTDVDLWPATGGHPRVRLRSGNGNHLEPPEIIDAALNRLVALIGACGPSDVVLGEKDFEFLTCAAHAVNDLHLPVRLHSVPTVRMASGLALSLRNPRIDKAGGEQAIALNAALTAGAFTAEHGAEAVLTTARGVLDAAKIDPEYLELRGLDFGPAPERGGARLLVAATIGGVRLIDNVGVPLGIGFRNLENPESLADAANPDSEEPA